MPVRSIKLMALVAAVAIVSAAPANAAKKQTHARHKATVAAHATGQGRHWGVDKFPAGPLYYNGGEYLGDDPDPNIRFQLWRDLGSHFGGEN